MMPDVPQAPNALSPRQWLLVLVIAVAALMPGIFQIPAMDRDEARYAQASRQMLESGDLVDIRFQDVPRHVKPVGTYWLQAASAQILGGGPQAGIWTYRMPSLLAAIGIVAMTAWLAARLGGATAGVAAGIVMALALITGVEARTAKTDALLVAAILAAQIALHRIATHPDRPDGFFGGGLRSPAAFWLFHGIGLLIKGPIITLVVGTTIAAWCLWNRDRELLRRLYWLPGVALTLAVVAPWVVAITLKVGPGFLQEAIGHALLGKVARGDDSHGAPPGYHSLFFLLVFWPGTALAAGGAMLAWTRRISPDIRFLICWIVPTFVVFEAVATKLPHYTFPAYPAMAVLAGLFLAGGTGLIAGGKGRIAQRVLGAIAVLVSLAVAAVPVAAKIHLTGTVTPATIAATGVGLVVVVLMIRFLAELSLARLVQLAVGVCVFYGLTFAVVAPSLDRLWIARSLQPVIARAGSCETGPLVTAGFSEPSMVFVHGTDIRLSDATGALDILAANPICAVAVVERRQRDDFLAGVDALGLKVEAMGEVSGLNYSRGREIDITVYRVVTQ
ncbi:4-amino-4-deoxy-L-arabinose transferase [Thalassobaculum litoreum DSM 18839]|uniref:4-amino-4-deoxy-L-arabinose transferase n=2 Tax=Thalassobaculaceae TaxID=2844864 RepID=A0A8G2BLD9_9PROT|nr:4-amino-4-deoxy-L-arabinose transferase [Thalassobaculum litoreum DSM 18839]